MKQTLKILLLTLFVCLLCAVTLTSCGESKKTPSEGLWMEHYDDIGGYMVKGIGSCKDTDLIIPSEYNGKAVVAIGGGAFYQNANITSVTIPASVKEIRHSAFAYCENLTKVEIANGLEKIEEVAFLECKKLASITLPDSIKSIERMAFRDTAYYHNENNRHYGVLYIGKHLIEADYNLTTCQIKDGTLTIADCAFFNHQKLTSVTIPQSVTSMGKTVFSGCTSLEKINCQAASQPAGWHSAWNDGVTDSTEIIWNS